MSDTHVHVHIHLAAPDWAALVGALRDVPEGAVKALAEVKAEAAALRATASTVDAKVVQPSADDARNQ